ncbi:hypothetical protein OAM67_00205 [bacterium]|nr:hypothetical protein [bacterium]
MKERRSSRNSHSQNVRACRPRKRRNAKPRKENKENNTKKRKRRSSAFGGNPFGGHDANIGDCSLIAAGDTLQSSKELLDQKVEEFVTQQRSKFKQEQLDVGALRFQVADIEEHCAQMTARWQIHDRKDLEQKAQRLRNHIESIEAQESLAEFERDAREFRQVYTTVAETELQQQKEDQLNHPKNQPQKRKVVTMRRRHVSKPEQRVLLRGTANAAAVADAFMERYDGEQRPVCMQSDKECSACGGELVLDVKADVLVCRVCWNEQQSTITSNRNIGYSNADSVNLSACRYRREVHFIAHMDRFCGLLGADKVTDALLDELMEHFARSGVRLSQINNSRVEDALRDLGHNELVIYKTIITSRITGIPPPRFSPDERNQLLNLFLTISNAFNEVKKRGEFANRINFMSYNYTLYKEIELFTWGERLQKNFRLFKGKENLAKQDQLWRACCKECGLRFISSV